MIWYRLGRQEVFIVLLNLQSKHRRGGRKIIVVAAVVAISENIAVVTFSKTLLWNQFEKTLPWHKNFSTSSLRLVNLRILCVHLPPSPVTYRLSLHLLH
jgi:hypothetical protein